MLCAMCVPHTAHDTLIWTHLSFELYGYIMPPPYIMSQYSIRGWVKNKSRLFLLNSQKKESQGQKHLSCSSFLSIGLWELKFAPNEDQKSSFQKIQVGALRTPPISNRIKTTENDLEMSFRCAEHWESRNLWTANTNNRGQLQPVSALLLTRDDL